MISPTIKFAENANWITDESGLLGEIPETTEKDADSVLQERPTFLLVEIAANELFKIKAIHFPGQNDDGLTLDIEDVASSHLGKTGPLSAGHRAFGIAAIVANEDNYGTVLDRLRSVMVVPKDNEALKVDPPTIIFTFTSVFNSYPILKAFVPSAPTGLTRLLLNLGSSVSADIIDPTYPIEYIPPSGFNAQVCWTCRKEGGQGKLMVCGACRQGKYCDVTCQRKGWKVHNIKCRIQTLSV